MSDSGFHIIENIDEVLSGKNNCATLKCNCEARMSTVERHSLAIHILKGRKVKALIGFYCGYPGQIDPIGHVIRCREVYYDNIKNFPESDKDLRSPMFYRYWTDEEIAAQVAIDRRRRNI
jgi:hypothetical protein